MVTTWTWSFNVQILWYCYWQRCDWSKLFSCKFSCMLMLFFCIHNSAQKKTFLRLSQVYFWIYKTDIWWHLLQGWINVMLLKLWVIRLPLSLYMLHIRMLVGELHCETWMKELQYSIQAVFASLIQWGLVPDIPFLGRGEEGEGKRGEYHKS